MTAKVFVKLNVIVMFFGIGISAHAVPIDEALTNTVQIRTSSNNPYFSSEGQEDLVAVNLYYSGTSGTHAAEDQPDGTVNGVDFDNIDMWNDDADFPPDPGPYALSANGIGPYVAVSSVATYNNCRSQDSAIAGPDAADLSAVDDEFYWLYSGSSRSPFTLTFTGLGVSEGDALYVQLIGGRQLTASGNLSVTVNGSEIGNWEFPGTANQAELFAIETTAGAGGSLTLRLDSVEATRVLGLSGVIISAAQGAQAATRAVPLINTAQIRTDSNNPYFNSASQEDLVGVNLYYSGTAGTHAAVDQPDGTVNGVAFDNIDMWNDEADYPAPGPYALSANGIGPYVSVASVATYNNCRDQNSVIDGTDAANLKAVDDEFYWLYSGSSRSPFTLTFTGLGVPEGRALYVQLIGGRQLTASGHLSVTVNGSAIGNWLFPGTANVAELFAFETTAAAGGSLTLTLASVEATRVLGLSGVIITAGPPQGTLVIVH